MTGDGVPILQVRPKFTVLCKVGILQIIRARLCQLFHQLLQGALPVVLWIKRVEPTKRSNGSVLPQMEGKRREIDVVPGGVASQDQPRLDAQHFGLSRHGHGTAG